MENYLSHLRAKIEVMRAREDALLSSLAYIDGEIASFPSKEARMASFDRMIQALQTDYQALVDRQIQARMERVGTSDWNVLVLQPAAEAEALRTRDTVRLVAHSDHRVDRGSGHRVPGGRAGPLAEGRERGRTAPGPAGARLGRTPAVGGERVRGAFRIQANRPSPSPLIHGFSFSPRAIATPWPISITASSSARASWSSPGEVGVGKTLVIRALLGQLPDDVETAIVMNARLTFRQLLYMALIDFGLTPTERVQGRPCILALQEFLLRLRDREERRAHHRRGPEPLGAGHGGVPAALEPGGGQHEAHPDRARRPAGAAHLLARPGPAAAAPADSRDLRSAGLPPDAVGEYIDFRTQVASEGKVRGLFHEAALDEVGRLTGGIPRLINQLCDRSLLVAYAQGADRVDGEQVRKRREKNSRWAGTGPDLPAAMLYRNAGGAS